MLYSQIMSRTAIKRGWSSDSKYHVTCSNGMSYLLRISDIKHTHAKQRLFAIHAILQEHTLPINVCVECGICDEGVYMMYEWIDGADAQDIIPKMHPREQYLFGLDAGRLLSAIHSSAVDTPELDWSDYFTQKVAAKIRNYESCQVTFEGSEFMVRYIHEHIHLLKERPITFHHGDYHIGNMMIQKNTLTIIDFDRFSFGDPWEEFNRIVWSAQKAPAFATGLINGYFPDGVPPLFWDLLALYISSNMLSSIPWAIPYGKTQLDVMFNQAHDVLTWYQDMTCTIPTWYTQSVEVQDA